MRTKALTMRMISLGRQAQLGAPRVLPTHPPAWLSAAAFTSFFLQVGHTVQEVKHHPTLGQLPAQQFMQLRGWHIWGGRRGLSLGPSCCSSGQG